MMPSLTALSWGLRSGSPEANLEMRVQIQVISYKEVIPGEMGQGQW